MALDKWERGSTWKTQLLCKSGSTLINCSGNYAELKIYDPNATVVIDTSGQHQSIGTYIYYVSTQTNQDLGIWLAEWKFWFDYSGPWGYSPKYDRYPIQLVHVKQ